MRIVPESQAATYTAQCWITNGGLALAVDPSPNVTPPAANRIITIPSYIVNASTNGASGAASPSYFSVDGTTATCRVWWYDDVQAIWVSLQTPQAVTTAGANVINLTIRHAVGVKLFCQVTANTGVTKIAFLVR